MVRFYGTRIKNSEMKLEEVPTRWREKTKKWLEENV